MDGEDCFQPGHAGIGQMDMDHPAVGCITLALDQAETLEIVDDGGDITAAFKHFLAYFALRKGAQVVQRLEHRELRDGQAAERVAFRQAGEEGIGAAGQLDEAIEGARFCTGTGEVSRLNPFISTSIILISK